MGCQSNQGVVNEAPVLDLSYTRSLFQYHPYQKSDTLDAIAHAYDVGVEEILSVNHLSKNQSIPIGRVLKIPQLLINNKPVQWQPKQYKAMLLKGWSSPMRAVHKTTKDVRGGWMLYPRVAANVRSTANGKVVYVGRRTKDLGTQVIVQHANNQSTLYALLGEVKVKKNQIVKQGQLIGEASLGASMKPNVYFDRIKT